MKRFTYKNSTLRRSSPLKKTIGSIAFFVAIFLLFIYGTGSLASGNHERQRDSLQNAINRDIIYCYATTGSYPENLAQLTDEFGLTYDEDTFFVDYRVRGQNLMPEVTIIERNKDAR